MDDIYLVTIVALLVLVALVIPIGLFIWVAILSSKISKLRQDVLALQNKVGLAPIAPATPSFQAAVSAPVTQELPIASAPQGVAPAYANQQVAQVVPTPQGVAPAYANQQVAQVAPAPQGVAPAYANQQVAQVAPAPQGVAPAYANQQVTQVAPTPQGVAPAYANQQVAQVAPTPEATATAKPASESGDMASFMLGNLFNKLGALVVIIAVGIFVKLISPFVFFSPWMKLAIGYLAGTVSLGAGLLLHRKDRFRNYGEVLVGLGLAIDFIITYCSCTIFAIWSDHTALLVSCFLLALVYALAASMKRPSMLILGLIAGYANLALDDGISATFTVVYLSLLNIMTMVTIYRGRMWMWVSNVNLALTLSVFAVMLAPHERMSSEAHFVASCIALWAIYVVFDIMRYRRGVTGQHIAIPSYFNFLLLSLYTGYHMVTWDHGGLGLGLALFTISIGYGALAFYYGFVDTKVKDAHINMSLLALLVGFEVIGLGILQVFVLVGLGLVLAGIASSHKRVVWANWSIAFLFASPWAMFVISPSYPLAKASQAVGIGSLYLFQIGLPAAGFLLASSMLKRCKDGVLDAQRNACQLFGWTALYTLASVELVAFFDDAVCGWRRRFVQNCSILSILASAYAAQWFLAGQTKAKSWMKALAYIVYTGTLIGLGSMLCVEVSSSDAIFVPFLNMRTVAVLSALVATYIIYRSTAFRTLAYIALVIAWLGLHLDALALADMIDLPFAVTLVWLVYAASIVLFGIYKPHKDCTYGGIALVLLTVWRLFMVDAADLASIYKLFLFMAVGGALLGLSFFYTKAKR